MSRQFKFQPNHKWVSYNLPFLIYNSKNIINEAKMMIQHPIYEPFLL